MRHSSNPRSSPAACSTTSIQACQIRHHGRRSSRGTSPHPTYPPSRTWSTGACHLGAAVRAPSSSSPRTVSANCTTAPRARRWPQTGRAASPRRPPRRRPRKARTSRCGCCAARSAARISCPSHRWSRSTWTRRGWTTRRSSSRRYRKTYPVSPFFSFDFFHSRYRRHRTCKFFLDLNSRRSSFQLCAHLALLSY
jgi:hypothetical protein